MTAVIIRSAERGARLAAILYGVQSGQAQWWADQLMSVRNSKNPQSWKDQLDSDEKCSELIIFNKSFDLPCKRSPSVAKPDRINVLWKKSKDYLKLKTKTVPAWVTAGVVDTIAFTTVVTVMSVVINDAVVDTSSNFPPVSTTPLIHLTLYKYLSEIWE